MAAVAAQGRQPAGWTVTTGDRVEVIHPERAESLARDVAATAPVHLAAIERALGLPRWEGRVSIYLVPDAAAGRELRGILPRPPDWAAGYALRSRPVLVLGTETRKGPLVRGLWSLLRHELVHIRMDQEMGYRTAQVPSWFLEGAASVLAHEGAIRDVVYLARLALTTPSPSLDEIRDSFPSDGASAGASYVASYAFVVWLVHREGTVSIGDVMAGVSAGRDFEEVFREVYGASPSEMEKRWRRGFHWRYRWIPLLTSGTTLWLGVTALFFLAGWRRRNRARARLEEWEAEERFYRGGGDWDVH